ncbi:extracellular solute-binding protein, family 1, partial [Streptomyces sp. SPB78]
MTHAGPRPRRPRTRTTAPPARRPTGERSSSAPRRSLSRVPMPPRHARVRAPPPAPAGRGPPHHHRASRPTSPPHARPHSPVPPRRAPSPCPREDLAMSRTPRRTPRTAHRARRIALLTTATATATALLAACGGDGGGSAAKDSSGRLVLTEMDYYNTDPTMSALPKLLDSCGRKAGVTVRRKIVPDLRTKLIQLAGSHAVPDLVLLDNPDLQQLAATGALTDLGAAGLRTEGLYENVVAAGQYEGKLYGVAPGVNSLALFYDKKLLTDAGLTPPTTWDALGKAAKKLTSGKRHGLGFAVPATEEGSFQFESFFLSAGAELSKLDSPEAVRALTFLDTLVKEGAAPKDVLSWTQANVQEQFANGSLGMMVNGPWQLPQLKKAGMSEADYGVVPMPVPAKGGTPSGALGG